ncbi:DUF6906 family protein [Desulfitobacterium dehalogenans]|uniref:DUF6906 family protein n=1 Tax=Desulfitobacterium dehalogenans TaxID=36854 RepID=UPI0009FCC3F5
MVYLKHGKSPTRRQKELIEAHRLNADSWLVTKNTPTEMEIVHRVSGNVRECPGDQKIKEIGGKYSANNVTRYRPKSGL